MSNVSFPLAKLKDCQFRTLGETLWSWEYCADCKTKKSCSTNNCPSHRWKQLARFFEHYRELTSSYEPRAELGEQPALRTHEELFDLIKNIKQYPNRTRSQVAEEVFKAKPIKVVDQERAINLAVRILIMVNCSARYQHLNVLEQGLHQVQWPRDMTFDQFMSDTFPTTDRANIYIDDQPLSELVGKLSAKKLRKYARLRFIPTDDMSRHLHLNRRTSELEIFHHTAYLKEYLRLTLNNPQAISPIPRQLALEVIDSLQKVLFPLHDPQSLSILRSLTRASNFDPDILRFEAATIRSPEEKDIQYQYFGTRLLDLYEEIQNPKPKGWIEKWFERKSAARHVMMATLIGVIIAVLLGTAGLAVAILQTWIAWQQWKHPVSP